MFWLQVRTEVVELIWPPRDNLLVSLSLSHNTPCNPSHWLSISRKKETGKREGILDQDAWFSIPVPTVTVIMILNKSSCSFLSHPFLYMFPIFSSMLSFSLSFHHAACAQAYPEDISDLVVAGGSRTEKYEWGHLVK